MRDRRQPRAVQDFVGVRVADAGEEPRIGQRPLQRVVLARKARGERREVRVLDLQAAGVEARERRLADDEVQRARRFVPASVNASVPSRELESRERDPRRRLRRVLEPAQPPRDHQMQDEIAFTRERDDDALAEPAHVVDAPALGVADRRHGSAQYEGIDDPHPHERLSADACGERLDVDGEVGKLRHRCQSALRQVTGSARGAPRRLRGRSTSCAESSLGIRSSCACRRSTACCETRRTGKGRSSPRTPSGRSSDDRQRPRQHQRTVGARADLQRTAACGARRLFGRAQCAVVRETAASRGCRRRAACSSNLRSGTAPFACRGGRRCRPAHQREIAAQVRRAAGGERCGVVLGDRVGTRPRGARCGARRSGSDRRRPPARRCRRRQD